MVQPPRYERSNGFLVVCIALNTWLYSFIDPNFDLASALVLWACSIFLENCRIHFADVRASCGQFFRALLTLALINQIFMLAVWWPFCLLLGFTYNFLVSKCLPESLWHEGSMAIVVVQYWGLDILKLIIATYSCFDAYQVEKLQKVEARVLASYNYDYFFAD